ncbi:MAG: sugar ABC transporter substrate-binding protein [Clostridiales bacterium]|nr:sugar ABC transporter substrate-binding protein [Clostridiales bacterium]
MKKLLSLLLMLAMVITIVPAVVAETDLEPITLTAFVGGPGTQAYADNKIYKKIEEEFGVTFEFEFLAGDLDEKLQLMTQDLTDLPDLFDGGNSAEKLIDAGALINLLDYVNPDDTPNLWAHIEPQKNRIITKDEDTGEDVMYIIPNYGLPDGPQIALSVGGPAFFIQKQVLAWDNYPQIHTLDEYFDLIERFLEANPTNADGTPYIGFDILCEDWRRFCMINPVQHLMGRPNDGEVLIDINSEDYATETFINRVYAKPYYQKLNEEFHKGIISPDTFVMTYDQYIAQLSTGIVLGMFDQAWDFGDATNALKVDGKDENTYVALGLIYDEDDVADLLPEGWTIEEHYLNGSLPNLDRGFGISVSCKCPERIIAMWERMMDADWQLLLNWGVEGEDYSIVDGRLTMTAEQYANTQDVEWQRHNKARYFFESSPKRQGWILDGDLAGNCWEIGNQDEIVFGLMNDYDKQFLAAYGYSKFADFVNPPIDLAPYGEAWQIDKAPIEKDYNDFLKIQDTELPQVIMASTEEFDAKWDAFVEHINPSCEVYSNFMHEEVLKLVAAYFGD